MGGFLFFVIIIELAIIAVMKHLIIFYFFLLLIVLLIVFLREKHYRKKFLYWKNKFLALSSCEKIPNVKKISEYTIVSIFIKNIKTKHIYFNDSSFFETVFQKIKEIIFKTFGDETLIVKQYTDEIVLMLFNKNNLKEKIFMLYENLNKPFYINKKFLSFSFQINVISKTQCKDINFILSFLAHSRIKEKKEIVFYDENSLKQYRQNYIQKERFIFELKNNIFDNFSLFFQPQVDKNGKIVGLESLLRWKYNNKFIPPFLFFTYLQNYPHLNNKINLWVLKNTVKCIKKLNIPISCNIMSSFLENADFFSDLKKIIDKNNIDPSKLGIEILESELFKNFEKVKINLKKAKEIKINILIDDFGDGNSNVKRLLDIKNFIDKIKIDKNIVDKTLPDDNEIFQAVVNFAKLFCDKIIVEGIETEEQAKKAFKSNIYAIQGFYFYRPMDLKSIEKILQK